MITMKHVPSGRTMELSDNEATKKRILERCGWAEVVALPDVPLLSLLSDIPEEEELPNDAAATTGNDDDAGDTTTSDDAAAQPAKPAKARVRK